MEETKNKIKYSYSRIQCYWDCPQLYKWRYIDKLKTKPDTSPTCALYEGTSLHEAVEKRDIKHGLDVYKSNYKTLNIANDIELYKLEKAMQKAIDQVPHGEYEYKLLDEDGFIGFIDLLVKVDDNTYDLIDLKFSNSDYSESGQVHIYKYYYERITGNKIRDLYYANIPKCPDKYEEGCDIEELKQKIDKFYDSHDVTFNKVEFDRKKVNFFFARKALLEKEKIFEKRYSFKCNWCDLQKYCKTNGKDKSELLEENIVKEVSLWD